MKMITIGSLVIFGIILLPVYIAVIAAFIGKPRQPKFAALVYGSALALTIVALVGIWIFGTIVSLIIP
jgi:hypothetical protein